MLISCSKNLVKKHLITIYNRGFKERAKASVKPGANLVIDGEPHRVTHIIQGKKGKGGGFVKAKLKSLMSGNVYEKLFLSDEIVEHAELESESVQYSWEDSDEFIFMHSTTFEEIRIAKEDVPNSKFMQADQTVKLQKYNDKVIGSLSFFFLHIIYHIFNL